MPPRRWPEHCFQRLEPRPTSDVGVQRPTGDEPGRPRGVKVLLLNFDLGARRLDLLLDLVGFGLGDAFLKGLGRAFDEGLRFG